MSDPLSLILVCGGRNYSDTGRIYVVLGEYLPGTAVVIHGDARGADRLAASEASKLGFWVESYPADWENHGKAAGPIRNREMLDAKPDLVIAFGGGKGTADTVREARKRGIPVREEA